MKKQDKKPDPLRRWIPIETYMNREFEPLYKQVRYSDYVEIWEELAREIREEMEGGD